jgi:hypothetical protein
MRSRLVNIRLDEERMRRVGRLRENGVPLSTLVREAIDERFAALGAARTPSDMRAVVARIYEQYPDPPGRRVPIYDVHDRRRARRAILRALKRRRQ